MDDVLGDRRTVLLSCWIKYFEVNTLGFRSLQNIELYSTLLLSILNDLCREYGAIWCL